MRNHLEPLPRGTKGSILSEAGVCISAIRLLNSLHEQAWVQVGRGNDTEKIRFGTRSGGGQGSHFQCG